jgi:hypothetical protein
VAQKERDALLQLEVAKKDWAGHFWEQDLGLDLPGLVEDWLVVVFVEFAADEQFVNPMLQIQLQLWPCADHVGDQHPVQIVC